MSNEDDGTTVPASATQGSGRPSGRMSGAMAGYTGAAQAGASRAGPSGDASSGAVAPAADASSTPLAGAERRTSGGTARDAGNAGANNGHDLTGNGESDAGRRKRRRRRRRRKPREASAEPALQPVDAEPPRRARRPSRRPGRRAAEPTTVETAPPPKPRPKPRARPTESGRSNLYAALDLGTNNCRLLVATPRPRGDFRVVDAFSRIVRLGEGLAGSGRLSDEAMDRAVEALKVCAGKLGSRPVRRLRLIATEACRRATNGEAFIQRVGRETGLELEIVDRETEARLAVSGCGVLVDRQAKGAVLFDIGGGSSELSLLDMRRVNKANGRGRKRGRRPADAIAAWTSLPLGVVTLSEKHGGGRAVTRHVFENMVEEVMDLLARFEGRDVLRELTGDGDVHLLGTSGTVTTLAGVHLQLPRYDRRYVDGVWMRSADVDRTIDDLIDMGFDSRVANPCIGRDRADLVLAGCAILVAIQRMWPCERLRVADRGLREGILSELMHEDGAWRVPKPGKRGRA